jgi:hypothetical protein
MDGPPIFNFKPDAGTPLPIVPVMMAMPVIIMMPIVMVPIVAMMVMPIVASLRHHW